MNEHDLHKTVRASLAVNYGIEGRLERLPGENLNYLVNDIRNQKYVIKIVDEHMPPAVVAMEYAAIEHAVKVGFPLHLPRIIKTKNGKIETGIKIRKNGLHRSRVIEFLGGTGMSDLSDISDSLLFDLGKTLAGFDQAMEGFDHPAAHRNHRWNLAQAEQHESKISLIDEVAKRQLLEWAFGLWRDSKSQLAGLPWQFIHGDAHDENVLVEDGRVSGLIDFGDCCFNPTVCELAICLTYLMMRGDDPLHVARLITAGYQDLRRLSGAELDMVYPLVCARLAVSVCVANKRKTIDPDNPNWFGGEGATWRMLRRLQDIGPKAVGLALRAV
jgi:Ser/Thr protein kinase RdoA (MazF antagonist)